MPVFLIFVLIGGILVFSLRNFRFQFDWENLLPSSALVKPIPDQDLEGEIKESFLPLNLELEEIDFSDPRKIIATFSGNLTVVFSKEKNLDFQVDTLQFILWRAKIDGKGPSFIDLRFDKPVLRI